MGNQFAIPYNGFMEPHEYIKALIPYIDSVESVYFSMPSMMQSQQDLPYTKIGLSVNKSAEEIKEIVDINCRSMMELLKSLPVKTVLALNGILYDMSPFSRKVFIQNSLLPLVEDELIDSIIISDFGLAIDIHAYFPHIELQVSCNANPTTPRNMDLWNEKTGATYFNPPRETIRNREMLKMFRDTGYTIKVIVNDYCLYGCPQYIAHPINQCFCNFENGFPMVCCFVALYNIFRINFILPHNLHRVEPFIDVFKIVGRQQPINKVFYRLDAYVNKRKDVDLLELLPGNLASMLRKKYGQRFTIPTADLPDKFMFCECNCHKHCKNHNTCKETLIKILEKQNINYDGDR